MARKYMAHLLIWLIFTTAFISSNKATSDFFIRIRAQPAKQHSACIGTKLTKYFVTYPMGCDPAYLTVNP